MFSFDVVAVGGGGGGGGGLFVVICCCWMVVLLLVVFSFFVPCYKTTPFFEGVGSSVMESFYFVV